MVMGSKYLKLAFDKTQATLIFSLYAQDKMNEIYYAIYIQPGGGEDMGTVNSGRASIKNGQNESQEHIGRCESLESRGTLTQY